MGVIDNLVDDLEPMTPYRPMSAYALALVATLVAAVVVSYFFGMRSDIAAGHPAQIVLIRSAALLLLGAATLQALAMSALPNVGVSNTGWKWTVAVAAAFPALTLVSWAQGKGIFFASAGASSSLTCLCIIVASSLLIAAPLVVWLRKGAPVHINQTATLLGIASGALGAFCYNLYCPSSSVEYVGIWYSAGVLISALAGRLIIPPLIRW